MLWFNVYVSTVFIVNSNLNIRLAVMNSSIAPLCCLLPHRRLYCCCITAAGAPIGSPRGLQQLRGNVGKSRTHARCIRCRHKGEGRGRLGHPTVQHAASDWYNDCAADSCRACVWWARRAARQRARTLAAFATNICFPTIKHRPTPTPHPTQTGVHA